MPRKEKEANKQKVLASDILSEKKSLITRIKYCEECETLKRER